MLVYLKTYPLQVVQGRLCGMGQSKAHQWIHVLLVVLRATLRTLGDAPTRPEPSQPRPEHPIGRPETRAINGLLVDRQLMPQGQVFQAQ